jgi:hypothetical protein
MHVCVLPFSCPALVSSSHLPSLSPLCCLQVWAEQYKRPLRPQRNPAHRNFLNPSEYPLEELPPFAIGPHFLLSGDLARYVGQNVNHLRSARFTLKGRPGGYEGGKRDG